MITVSDIGEDALVQRLTAHAPLGARVLAGPGDDCAVVEPPPTGFHLLLKTDAVIEGIHFLPQTEPERVGRKAMARVLSDIAAMGGEPREALVTLVLPADTPVDWVERVYVGLHSLAQQFGVDVVGGETSRGAERILAVTLTGQVRAGRAILRSGGKAGDALMVTGKLGGSLAGHHLDFLPRVVEGQWLTQNVPVHAMMDLSDGLARDLPKMAMAAELEYLVDWERLPLRNGCDLRAAWTDGEDYELLMAIPQDFAGDLLRSWELNFPDVSLTRIGRLVHCGEGIAGPAGGWDSLREN